MITHNKLVHLGQRPHLCKFCSKTYKTSAHLSRHVNALHATLKNKYPCNKCSKVFVWEDSLRMHIRRHGEDKGYKCQLCSRIFFTKTEKNTH